MKGAIEELPIEDASFDVVICSQVLEHCDDPVKAVSELRRVTSLEDACSRRRTGHARTTLADRLLALDACGLELFVECGRESVRVTPSSGTTACLGYSSRCLDLAFRRIRLGFAAKPVIAMINTVAMGIDGRSTSLRDPGPSGLFASFHVVAEAQR